MPDLSQSEALTSGQREAALQNHLHLAQHQRVLSPWEQDGDVAPGQPVAADGAERTGTGIRDGAAAAREEEMGGQEMTELFGPPPNPPPSPSAPFWLT